MSADDLARELLALPDAAAQRRVLEERAACLDEALAQALKREADAALRVDLRRSLQIVELMRRAAEVGGHPLARALALLAEANTQAVGGLGEYQESILLYDEAAAIYAAHGRPVEQARSQIGKLYALTCLGRYAEAVRAGEWAAAVLEAHQQWHRLADVTVNLAINYVRMGQDARGLEFYERARQLYQGLDQDVASYVAWVDQNMTVALRNLGRFPEAIAASERAFAALDALGQRAEAIRARQNLALTYFVLGRYNDTLLLLDEVRNYFLGDGRPRDAILVELFISDCLLQLRRFDDVLDKCRRVRAQFAKLGTRFEVGEALMNEAAALCQLRRYGEARASLAEARELFLREGNAAWVARADLEAAQVLLAEGRAAESADLALAATSVFHQHEAPVAEAQAALVAAKARAQQGQREAAHRLVEQALAIGEGRDIPFITYQGYRQRGALLAAEGALRPALVAYEQAIVQVERLRGQLMIEHRAAFAEDKQAVYGEAAALCLDADDPRQALHYVERAKSRALLDLLAHRLDLGLLARSEGDQELVQELLRLRGERDRLHRDWISREQERADEPVAADEERQVVERRVLALEREITDRWHRLLIHNADYARDASLWQVRVEEVQPYLPPQTALLEYDGSGGELAAYVVTPGEIVARRLPGALSRAERLLRLLRLNLQAVPASPPREIAALEATARGILKQLHGALLAPLDDLVEGYPRLIVVPHGALHYLPFHALYDGQRYAVQSRQITYLPAASVLRYCREARPATGASSGAVVLGHSHGGLLPQAVREAQVVAELLGAEAQVEQQATLGRLREAAGRAEAIHVAAHGEFRPDNPLFSGLALEDGWLTTLDVFGLRLRASLVVLSACQTGQSVVGGGDELQGLTRAFLYAGAAALLLSLWRVEDRSTAWLMTRFYARLAEGWDKAAALSDAQQQLILGQMGVEVGATADAAYAHPYFWAPFFLVGDSAPLRPRGAT